MHICANTLIYLEDSARTAVEKLVGLGFTAVDLFGDEPTIDYGDPDRREVGLIRKFCEDHGVELSLHGPCWDWNPASASRRHRQDVVEHYCQGIRLAAALGAKTMVVHSGWLSDPKFSACEALGQAIDTISRCIPEAERAGVTLAVENVGYGSANMFRRVTDWVKIAKNLASPSVGLTLDVGHAHLQGFCLHNAVLAAGPLLRHVHLHSNDGHTDRHLPLDQGVIDIAPAIKGLQEIGFAGHAAIEIYTATDKEAALLASRHLLEELLTATDD
jgi:sugar phosphate isomerase/epimerase